MKAFFPIYLKNYDIIRWAGTRFAVYFASNAEWRRPLSALRATLPEGESKNAAASLATLLAELALKRQFGKDSRRGKQENGCFQTKFFAEIFARGEEYAAFAQGVYI